MLQRIKFNVFKICPDKQKLRLCVLQEYLMTIDYD